MNKRCTKCDKIKSIDEFHRKRDRSQPWCKLCMRDYMRDRYHALNADSAERKRQAEVAKSRAPVQKAAMYMSSQELLDCFGVPCAEGRKVVSTDIQRLLAQGS